METVEEARVPGSRFSRGVNRREAVALVIDTGLRHLLNLDTAGSHGRKLRRNPSLREFRPDESLMKQQCYFRPFAT